MNNSGELSLPTGYGLNVSPQNSYIEILIPKGMELGGGRSGGD